MIKRIALGFISASCLCGAAAYADGDAAAYVGASIGKARTAVDKLDFDESATAYKVFVGYSFNPYAAIELDYADAGSPKIQRGNTSITVSPTGVAAFALARYPFGKSYAVYGKFGFAFYDTDTTSDVDLAYGLGGMMSIGDKFEVRAEYEKVIVKDGDFSMFSVGGVFKF
jgi:OmpA-OmpF porin, OOP family